MIEIGPTAPDAQTYVIHARGVLEAIQTVYEQENVDLPARQFINVGGAQDTAWDCEQLVVSVEQVYNGLPGQQAQQPTRCDEPTTVVVTIQLVRCAPTPRSSGRSAPQPVTPEQHEEFAEKMLIDARLLMTAGQLFGDLQNYLGSMADVTITGPQGGYQALMMSLIAAAA